MATPKTKIKLRHGADRLARKRAAFINGRVVDSAATLPALAKKLRSRKFVSRPSVMLVPHKDEGPYILAGIHGLVQSPRAG